MGFKTADMPPVDPAQFESMPFMDRMRMLATHWCEYGFGSPKQLVLSIRAFSRPVGPAARLAGPLTGMLQRLALRRYLRALDGAAGRRPLS